MVTKKILFATEGKGGIYNPLIQLYRIEDIFTPPLILFCHSSTESAGSAYYNTMMNVCYKAGFIPKVKLEASEIETILSYVSTGMGISLIPALLQKVPVQGVVYKELLDQTSILGTAMAWKDDEKSHAAHAFIELVRQSLI